MLLVLLAAASSAAGAARPLSRDLLCALAAKAPGTAPAAFADAPLACGCAVPREIVWHLDLGGQNLHTSPSIGADGTIYVGTTGGLFAVRDDGTSGHVLPGWPVPTAGAVDIAERVWAKP